MPRNLKNIRGERFGRLEVLEYVGIKNTTAYWRCRCDCGKEIITKGSRLRLGAARSCGCWAREKASKQLKAYANSAKHRGAGNPQWKGGKAGYAAIHAWLLRHFRKESCDHCGCINKKLDWALIKGKKYLHRRENFIVLCRGCHLRYDYTKERAIRNGKFLLKARIKNRAQKRSLLSNNLQPMVS